MAENWIASRILEDSAGNEWSVRIGVPEQAGEHWECAYAIDKGGNETVGRAGGGDALQALSLAIETLAGKLEQTGETLTWQVLVSGQKKQASAVGDHGVYRLIPSAMGFPVYKKLWTMIENEGRVMNAEIMERRAQAQKK